MSNIHVLNDSTINKIAAGEVVERPASVIKELVENSLDAGAVRIEVEIMAGGTSFMRVTDNGRGMSREDAQLAILRHATSKIQEAGDLNSLQTLGFRGEALPTIASVSRFSLMTRQENDELGTQVDLIGGKIPDIRETGCNIGTTVKVEDLFFNTPARKKFLKTTNTEGGKINDFIIKLALSNTSTAFRFINNNKLSISTPGNGSLADTIQSIYGSKVSEALLGMDFEDTDINITGYITKPSMLRSSRSWQTFIVNGRIIVNKAISKAIDNAYHSLLPKSGYPLIVLEITVPANSIDVNVHPQKSEMKFEDEGRIFKAVYKAVVDAIRPAGQTLETVAASVQHPERHYTMEPMHFVPASIPAENAITSVSAPIPASAVQGWQAAKEHDMYPVTTQMPLQEKNIAEQIYQADFAPVEQVAETGKALNIAVEKLQEPLTPIGQVARCFIVAKTDKGLYIVDQHAAHERILYDKFASMADRIPSQQLLVHSLLDFSPRETELILLHQDLFRSLGFDMEPSGENQFRLREVPTDIPVSEAEDIIREILESLFNMHGLTAKEIRHACLATTACRAAIKAGDELNLRQMQIILDELAHTSLPYTCPHGRPTILRFSSDELAKMFKRT
jgi:DNA mismatch repair protein MutL